MSATRTDVEFSARENISKTSCAGVGTSTNQNGGEASASSEATEEERMWEQAWHQAAQRAEDECPICMCAMQPMNETRNPHAQYSEHKNDVQGRGPQSWPVTSGSKNARGVIGKNAAKFIPLRELESDAFGTSTASRNTPRQHRRGRGGFEGGQRARLLLSCSHTFHKTVRSHRHGKSKVIDTMTSLTSPNDLRASISRTDHEQADQTSDTTGMISSNVPTCSDIRRRSGQ